MRASRPRHGSAAWKRVRRAVLSRDGYRCRKCGGAGRLECHHVVSVEHGGSELDPGNLATICRSCHIAMHRRESADRAAWRRYLARLE